MLLSSGFFITADGFALAWFAALLAKGQMKAASNEAERFRNTQQRREEMNNVRVPSQRLRTATMVIVVLALSIMPGISSAQTEEPFELSNLAQEEIVNASWEQRAPPHAPPPRYYHGMAYDSARGVTVMFGGDNTGSARLNDTWEYDGTDWHRVVTLQSPPGRVNINYAMAFHAGRNKVVLFGGLTAAGYTNDTWEFDGSNWTHIFPNQSPPARDAHALVYDSRRNVIVLFGGHGLNGVAFNDTWEYDGVNWQKKLTQHAPSGRWYVTMAFDEKRAKTVVFGGTVANQNPNLSDTWEYDGNDWQQRTLATTPPTRAYAAIGFDSTAGVIAMYGGSQFSVVLADTWLYDGNDWTQMSPTSAPSKRSTPMVFDRRRQRFVTFSGGHWLASASSPTIYGDMWELSLGANESSNTDLFVDRIQVAQVLLTDIDPATGQPIPLIANKLTLVRVFVGVFGASVVSNVDVRLHIQDVQGQMHVVNRQNMNPLGFNVRSNPDPYYVNSAANFVLQESWLTGSVIFWAEVDPDNRIVESNETNNVGGNITKTFQPAKKMRIAWVPMVYAPPEPVPPPGKQPSVYRPDEQIAGSGMGFLQEIWPVGADDVDYFQQPGDQLLLRGKFSTSGGDEYYLALSKFWEVTTRTGGWRNKQPPDRLLGWVPQEALADICGVGFQKTPVAAAVAISDESVCIPSGQNVAHEMGHVLNSEGLLHAPNRYSGSGDPKCYRLPDPDTVDRNYPRYDLSYPPGTIGVWGVNPRSYSKMLLSPNETYDIESYCYSEWISPYHYNKLVEGFTPMIPTSQLQRVDYPTAPEPQLLVSGLVYSPAMTVTFDTFYPLTSTVPVNASSGSAYCLETRSTSNIVLDSRCFDLSFKNPETGDPTNTSPFILMIPYPASTQSVVLMRQGTELGRVTSSSNPPTIQLTSPSGGESWAATGTYTVTWTASDPDGDPLHFLVSYSADGGNRWMPIALDVATTYLAVDSRNLPGSNAALFKVEASDQFHSAVAMSAAPITMGRKGPQAFILSPKSDEVIPFGTALFIQGYASDLEDGTLGESALQWNSDRDGNLGTGNAIVSNLSPGQHTITLTATDSNSNKGAATIILFVGRKVFLPLLQR